MEFIGNIKKRLFITSFLIVAITLKNMAQGLENGDLLFNYSKPKDDFGGAIIKATNKKDDLGISHVAIVMKNDTNIQVIEAIGKYGVWICPLDTFINKAEHSSDGKPLILVGRLKDRSIADECVQRAQRYKGRPYDWLFSDTDEAIYCSELIHLSYLDKNGNFLFKQQPMSFHDEDGIILPYWIEYYKKRGLEVPEGAPGTNPADISKSNKIKLIKMEEL